MSDWHALVVCEGPSDFALLEAIIGHVGTTLNNNYTARLLKPQYDATSGRHEKNGWTGVRAWCCKARDQKTRPGRDIIGQELFWSRAQCLLIQMDTDIAAEIQKSDAALPGDPTTDRRGYCWGAVNHWLGIHATKPEVRVVLPTTQIETWLLATHDASPRDPDLSARTFEDIIDVEAHLTALGYPEDREKPGRLYKELELYRKDPRYAARLVKHLTVASTRCPELGRLLSEVIGRN
jgi:hypothetical protein